jgi:cell wall-associated NlpC family hydrolase
MPPGVVPAGAGGSPIEGLGYDHDSLGLFQQRASWGTAAQRLDPVTSTEMFMAAVLKVHAWASRDPWTVAQDVQVSAWDGKPRAANNFNSVYGGNYLANLDRAKRMVDRIDRDQSTATCGTLSGGLAASTEPGSQGLPPAYRIPAEATPAEARVVSYAIAQLDKPYVFGAAGPNAFDCSGLTMAAWRQGGAQLVHSTTAQAQEGTPTTPSGLMPGDLVLVPGDDGTLAAPGHVGLYIGSGLVLNAADEQIGIRVQTYDNFVAAGHGLSALRHIK